MSRTIEAIERHMKLPVRPGPQSEAATVTSRVSKLVAEWQQRGPETLSGRTFRKLRLVLVPAKPAMFASASA